MKGFPLKQVDLFSSMFIMDSNTDRLIEILSMMLLNSVIEDDRFSIEALDLFFTLNTSMFIMDFIE